MPFACPAPRATPGVDINRLLKLVASIPYEPPVIRRRVLYTPQFCKIPFKGQSLGEPRPEYERLGYTVGELFEAEGYTLIDVDFLEPIDTVKAWVRLVKLLGGDYIVYPTVRGLHIYIKGDYGPVSIQARVLDRRARIEVKPCKTMTCTSWYRTLNALRHDGSILVVNGRVLAKVPASLDRIDYRLLDLEAPEYEEVAPRLGLPLALDRPSTEAYNARGGVILAPGMLKPLGGATDNRLRFNSFKAALGALVEIEPGEILDTLERLHSAGLLPPCLEPLVTGRHENNRFATMVLLVASLTKAGFGLPESSWHKLCELLVARWGGSLSQCKAKLKSILVCSEGVCGFAYGSGMLVKVSHLWSCDSRRCPVGGCPGPGEPWKAVKLLGSYLRRVFTEVEVRDILRPLRLQARRETGVAISGG